jgi:hypothetical protein
MPFHASGPLSSPERFASGDEPGGMYPDERSDAKVRRTVLELQYIVPI